MIPDENYTAEKREANGNKDPIRKLLPVLVLHVVKRLLVYQFPGSENVYLMCPDGANVVEAKNEIENKKHSWIH